MSELHLLILLMVFAPFFALIFFAVYTAKKENGSMSPGFKGWLLIFAASQWLALLRVIAEAGKIANKNDIGAQTFPLLNKIDAAFIGLSLLIYITIIVKMTRKQKSFITLIKIQFGWAVISLPLSILLAVFILSAVYGVTVSARDIETSLSSEIGQWIGGLIGGSLWLAYVLRSKRVQLTEIAPQAWAFRPGSRRVAAERRKNAFSRDIAMIHSMHGRKGKTETHSGVEDSKFCCHAALARERLRSPGSRDPF